MGLETGKRTTGFKVFWIIALLFLLTGLIYNIVVSFQEPEQHAFYASLIILPISVGIWIGMYFFIPWVAKWIDQIVVFCRKNEKIIFTLLISLFITSIALLILTPAPYNIFFLILNALIFLILLVTLPFPFESIFLIPGMLLLLILFPIGNAAGVGDVVRVSLSVAIILILILLAWMKSFTEKAAHTKDEERISTKILIGLFISIALVVSSVLMCTIDPIYNFLIFAILHIIMDSILSLYYLNRNWDAIRAKIVEFYHHNETLVNGFLFTGFIIFLYLSLTLSIPFNAIFVVFSIILAIILPITLPFPFNVIFLTALLILLFILFPIITLYSTMWIWMIIAIVVMTIVGVRKKNRQKRRNR